MEWIAIGVVLLWLLSKMGKKPKSSELDTLKYFSSNSTTPATYNHSYSARSGNLARWVPSAEAITIAGIAIETGMIYVGGHFDSASNFSNCLIDPDLTVAKYSTKYSPLSYWPSYSNLEAPERRAFLEWLADGRRDTQVNIGYVFIFFYGLERRLFIDNAVDERNVLADEVKRLRDIYGSNNSFKRYADHFLEAAKIINAGEVSRPLITLELINNWEMPQSVKVYLGSKLKQDNQLDQYDCLLWGLSAPGSTLLTPARRCFKEFQELWQIRFNKRYPDGLKVNVPKSKLSLEYKSAMGFTGTLQFENIPDITATTAPLNKIRELVDECTAALDSYSRLIGRMPESANTLAAIMLLPSDLVDSSPNRVITNLKSGISGLLCGRDTNFVDTKKLIEVLGMDMPASLSKAQAVQLGQMLDRFDIGFEPDVRYGPLSLSLSGIAYLFKSKGGAVINPDGPLYEHYRTMVEVTALASASDGAMAEQEFDILKSSILAEAGLSETEKLRLFACAASMWKDLPRQQSVLKRLSQLSTEQKRKAADAAVAAVLADGVIAAGEVKFLEKLYKALGIPTENVYSDLHRGDSDDPVSVMPETLNSNDRPIPAQKVPAQAGVQLNTSKLERIKNDTAEVSRLLADIFVEDAEQSPAPVTPRTGGSNYQGLDMAHGQLLDYIMGNKLINRDDFEQMARTLRLLPDGAFETINEWAFEMYDEPLLDGEETITVASNLVEQIGNMRAA